MQERVLVDVSYKQGDELSSNNLLNLATDYDGVLKWREAEEQNKARKSQEQGTKGSVKNCAYSQSA
jgi:hypothetical protein